MKINKIILSIETAIEGGSISILDGGTEIDFRVGSKNVSRAEELLGEISALLVKNNIKKKEIGLIAVSNSAGSYTGIRIGLATALGLKKALGCRIKGVSVLEALALAAPTEGSLISAVSTNGRDIYLQTFEKMSDKIIRSKTDTELLDYETFGEKVFFGQMPHALFVNEKLYDFIYSDIKIKDSCKQRVFNAGKNLAKFLGRKVQDSDASDNVKQIYIREFK